MAGSDTLYLIRHGQTEFNLKDLIGGDPPLTDQGIRQAENNAGYLAHFHFDTIYGSTLKRSRQTAEIIRRKHPGASFIITDELCEILPGELDLYSYTQFKDEHPDLFAARERDKYHWSFPGGESYATALERVKPLLNTLIEERKAALIVGHQGMNRIILRYLLKLEQEEIPYLIIPNAVIFEIQLEPDSRVYHIKEGKRCPGLVK